MQPVCIHFFKIVLLGVSSLTSLCKRTRRIPNFPGLLNKILIYDGNEQSAELTSKMFDNRIDFPILHGWGGDGAI